MALEREEALQAPFSAPLPSQTHYSSASSPEMAVGGGERKGGHWRALCPAAALSAANAAAALPPAAAQAACNPG